MMKLEAYSLYKGMRLLICGAWLGVSCTGFALRLSPSPEIYSSEVVVSGLQYPGAITLDESGDLLVAEHGSRQISRIVDRTAYPFLKDNFQIGGTVSILAQPDQSGHQSWLREELKTPSDITTGPGGGLLVVESDAGGRLLEFAPFTDDLALAQVVTTPWMDLEHGLVQVETSTKGYLVVSTAKPGISAMPFGSVSVRRPDGEWLLIDHGPFASFSSLSIHQETGILLVCEENEGSLTWYDLEREMEIAHRENLRGIRHAVITSVGDTMVAIERFDGSWTIAEVDPNESTVFECQTGLSPIGGLFPHPDKNEIYVSLRDEGKIMRLRQIEQGVVLGEDGVEKLQKDFETKHYIAPKKWPAFFKTFIEKLGVVNPVDNPFLEYVSAVGNKGGRTMTLKEFSESVPLIAGKLKATLKTPGENEPDPLDEISFVIFYPNQSVVTRQTVAPSISLFRATTQKGRAYRTRFLPNSEGKSISDMMSWSELPEVLVSFPSGYFAPPTEKQDPNIIRVYFLGIGLGSDYWITLHRDNLSASEMIVEKTDRTRLVYALEPYHDEHTGEEDTSLIIAGLNRLRSEWIDIGRGPVRNNVIVGELPALNLRHVPRLKEFYPEMLEFNNEFFTGDAEEWQLSEDEINFRRTVVVRSATRW